MKFQIAKKKQVDFFFLGLFFVIFVNVLGPREAQFTDGSWALFWGVLAWPKKLPKTVKKKPKTNNSEKYGVQITKKKQIECVSHFGAFVFFFQRFSPFLGAKKINFGQQKRTQ